MKFWLESDIKNRARIHIDKTSLTVRQADSLAYHLEQNPSITRVKVYERTADVAIFYTGERKYIITFLKGLSLSLALVEIQGTAHHEGVIKDRFRSGFPISRKGCRNGFKVFQIYCHGT